VHRWLSQLSRAFAVLVFALLIGREPEWLLSIDYLATGMIAATNNV
jgi:hypothetical protein